jgi:acetyl esterase/lipase
MRRSTYAATTAVGAAAVVNAHRPFKRGGAAGLPSFVAGLVDSELPWARIATQLGVTGLAARSGLLRTRGGVALTAVNAATIAGAVHLRRIGVQAGDVLEAALVAELGSDYRSRIASMPGPPGSGRSRGALQRQHRRYVVGGGCDVAYGDAGKRNLLDVWKRNDLRADAGAPVVVQIHGGAWTTGNKRSQALPLLSTFAERGWVCVSATYRVSPRATWPDQIIDVLRAVAWTKQNIGRYGGDPGFIAITGGSAGGHLSALAALAAGDPDFQPGFEDVDTRVQAAVPLYGSYDWLNRNSTNHAALGQWVADRVVKQAPADARELFDRASPLSRVHVDAPPFFVIHGTNDSFLYVEQAREFADALRKASSSSVVYAELPAAQHAFDVIRSPRAMATVDAIERFLGVVRAEQPNA